MNTSGVRILGTSATPDLQEVRTHFCEIPRTEGSDLQTVVLCLVRRKPKEVRKSASTAVGVIRFHGILYISLDCYYSITLVVREDTEHCLDEPLGRIVYRQVSALLFLVYVLVTIIIIIIYKSLTKVSVHHRVTKEHRLFV